MWRDASRISCSSRIWMCVHRSSTINHRLEPQRGRWSSDEKPKRVLPQLYLDFFKSMEGSGVVTEVKQKEDEDMSKRMEDEELNKSELLPSLKDSLIGFLSWQKGDQQKRIETMEDILRQANIPTIRGNTHKLKGALLIPLPHFSDAISALSKSNVNLSGASWWRSSRHPTGETKFIEIRMVDLGPSKNVNDLLVLNHKSVVRSKQTAKDHFVEFHTRI